MGRAPFHGGMACGCASPADACQKIQISARYLTRRPPMTQDFEQSIVRGRAHWITCVVHEPTSSRLVIRLTDNGDSFKPTRAIEFLDIQQLEIRWICREDDCIEGLLGAHEEELAGL